MSEAPVPPLALEFLLIIGPNTYAFPIPVHLLPESAQLFLQTIVTTTSPLVLVLRLFRMEIPVILPLRPSIPYEDLSDISEEPLLSDISDDLTVVDETH